MCCSSEARLAAGPCIEASDLADEAARRCTVVVDIRPVEQRDLGRRAPRRTWWWTATSWSRRLDPTCPDVGSPVRTTRATARTSGRVQRGLQLQPRRGDPATSSACIGRPTWSAATRWLADRRPAGGRQLRPVHLGQPALVLGDHAGPVRGDPGAVAVPAVAAATTRCRPAGTASRGRRRRRPRGVPPRRGRPSSASRRTTAAIQPAWASSIPMIELPPRLVLGP